MRKSQKNSLFWLFFWQFTLIFSIVPIHFGRSVGNCICSGILVLVSFVSCFMVAHWLHRMIELGKLDHMIRIVFLVFAFTMTIIGFQSTENIWETPLNHTVFPFGLRIEVVGLILLEAIQSLLIFVILGIKLRLLKKNK